MIKPTEVFTMEGVDRCLWHAWFAEAIAKLSYDEIIALGGLTAAEKTKFTQWAVAIAADYRPYSTVTIEARNGQLTIQLAPKVTTNE